MQQMVSTDALERVACPVCGSDEHEAARMRVPRDDLAERLGTAGGRSSWVVCTACAMVFQSPRPRQAVVDDLYLGGAYHEHRGGIPEHYVQYSLRRSVPALTWALGVIGGEPGRALDIGSGIGGALVELRSRGWDVVGVEPDDAMATVSRDRFGLDASTGYFEASTAADVGPVDLAYSCHVFEHLQDPDAVVEGARSVLDDRRGHLVVVVPTFRRARTLAWKCFNSSHTLMFTHVSLGNVLRRHGFEPVAHRYVGAADSELWLIARAGGSGATTDGAVTPESVDAVQREIASVPFRMVLGLPGRARTHLRTLRADPRDFAARAVRSAWSRIAPLARRR